MSTFGSGGVAVAVLVGYIIAMPTCGFWWTTAAMALTFTIWGFALQGANDMYYPNGDRRPHHPTRNPYGPKRPRHR